MWWQRCAEKWILKTSSGLKKKERKTEHKMINVLAHLPLRYFLAQHKTEVKNSTHIFSYYLSAMIYYRNGLQYVGIYCTST